MKKKIGIIKLEKSSLSKKEITSIKGGQTQSSASRSGGFEGSVGQADHTDINIVKAS